MRRRTITLLVWLMSLTIPQSGHADVMCRWFGRCVYESPGFKIRVVDKETGKPLAGVHALAEWVQYGYQGSDGPLMAIDAVSSADGMLSFHKWGPISGSSAGLELNQDPVISVFKSGYMPLTINNMPGTDERARLRGFNRAGQIFKMEVFRGDLGLWVQELTKAAFLPTTRLSGAEEQEILAVYTNRYRLIKIEAAKLPRKRDDVEHLIDTLERSIESLQGGGKQ